MANEAGVEKTLRQRVMDARLAMAAKEKLKETAAAPARTGTNRALQWAWKALIPSWGLSSLWINIHVLLRFIFGEKLFCKLGDEWLPAQTDAISGDAGKLVKKSVGLVETMVLMFIDFIIFFIIVGFLAMFTNESTFKTMVGESNKAQPGSATQQTK